MMPSGSLGCTQGRFKVMIKELYTETRITAPVGLGPSKILDRTIPDEPTLFMNPCDLPIEISFGIDSISYGQGINIPPGQHFVTGDKYYYATDVYAVGPSDGLEVDILLRADGYPGFLGAPYVRQKAPGFLTRELGDPDTPGLVTTSGVLTRPTNWVGGSQENNVFSLIQRGGARFNTSRGQLGDALRLAAPAYLDVWVDIDSATNDEVLVSIAHYEPDTGLVGETIPTPFRRDPSMHGGSLQVLGPIPEIAEFAAVVLKNDDNALVSIGVTPRRNW